MHAIMPSIGNHCFAVGEQTCILHGFEHFRAANHIPGASVVEHRTFHDHVLLGFFMFWTSQPALVPVSGQLRKSIVSQGTYQQFGPSNLSLLTLSSHLDLNSGVT
jgi:hypothetical protein